jgi:tRNA(Ile)-lysidine synthase
MLRSSKLYRRWSIEMKRSGMFRSGERVATAVSGGPDSTLLLTFMKEFAREMGISVAVAHFNHRLRGSDSEADERFVARRAEDLGLEFFRGEADVASVARATRRNVEATARDLRYRFLFSLVNQRKVDKVTTAHTANDQAETVLLRLLRGAGARGLGGIYPVLDGKIVRPFLSLTRAEIESEIQTRRLEFRVDASNQDLHFARSRIRQILLPLLETSFNPAVVTLLSDLASRSRDDNAFLQQAASERAHFWRVRQGEEERIALRPLLEFHPAIQRRVLLDMIAASEGVRGVTSVHIEALRRFAGSSQSGKELVLPGGLRARKELEWLVIGGDTNLAIQEFSLAVRPPTEISLASLALKLRFVVSENLPDGAVEKGYNYTKAVRLDLDKVGEGLILRNCKPGDRFQPIGGRRALKLKELFLRQRIPAKSRKLWPVLVSNQQVVWVQGFPAAQDFAASDSTVHTLLIVQEESTSSAHSMPGRWA